MNALRESMTPSGRSAERRAVAGRWTAKPWTLADDHQQRRFIRRVAPIERSLRLRGPAGGARGATPCMSVREGTL